MVVILEDMFGFGPAEADLARKVESPVSLTVLSRTRSMK